MADKPVGFPTSWLDYKGHVKCVARKCNHVWTTNSDARWRNRHWHQNYMTIEGPEVFTDHKILNAMNKQTKCPHCQGYQINTKRQSIKELYEHELVVHGSEDTATISGFVKNLRNGRIEQTVALLAEKHVHQRLLQKIMSWSGWDGPRGLAKFWHIKPHSYHSAKDLESIIMTPNQNNGRPLYHPMTPYEFLIDLPPQNMPRQIEFDWAGKRSSLKQMYDNGEI